MTTYAQFAHIAQTWGLAIFVILFALVLVHALKPSNRERFERAARTPLQDD